MTAPEPALLDARDLLQLHASGTGPVQALRGIDLEVRRGTVTAVTGPSGSGKSTLLAVLALRERPAGGELRYDGRLLSGLGRRELQRLRRRVGWVAQRPAHSLFPQLAAHEQVAEVARLRGADDDPGQALADVGLEGRAGARLHELSGGEQQRLAVAAATTGPPDLLVADEPTAELDDASAGLVLRRLRACALRGAAVVLTTHDARATASADRVLALRHGVLSGEHRAGGPRTAAVDGQGRVQLPPDALGLFPDGRAVLEVHGGRVVLSPPGEGR
ncbi:ABC transporter ATP-binding protein [Vallicoccus soli]|uniref:ABC transporter ATP-binding protein n=1 Tax=Vallicoccus soli TaxID=2339232 RepID=A0A3A3ZJQ7_9ACTN|nr:ABC transporter ATP-binding protein [Vallicoccus soli]RJK95963.1 ABC transporter ATP-binding protein [Vallicoccus soli]